MREKKKKKKQNSPIQTKQERKENFFQITPIKSLIKTGEK